MSLKGAVVARILTQYSDKGTKAAAKDFARTEKQIKDFAKKSAAAFGLVAGMAAKVSYDAVKAAMEDQKSQAMLANALRGTTGATQEAIAATEDWISKQQLALGVADDELRPSLGRLAAVTGDISDAQMLLSAALDISAAKNVSLESAAAALAKGYGGQLTALRKLFPQISAGTVKAKDFAGALKEIQSEIGGAATTRAETFEFRMKRVKLAIWEASESLGYALLPAVEQFTVFMNTKGIPALQNFTAGLTGQGGVVNGFDVSQTAAYIWGERLNSLISVIVKFKNQLIILGAVIVGVFAVSSIASGVSATVAAIGVLIKAYNALKYSAMVAGIATAFATNPILGVAAVATGAAVLAGANALLSRDNKKVDELTRNGNSNDLMSSRYTAQIPKEALGYNAGLEKLTKATTQQTSSTKKLTAVMDKNDKATALKKALGLEDLQTDDLNTIAAVFLNKGLQKLVPSSPTISLAASAGANGSIQSPTTGNGTSITVNVAGSVVSEADLLTQIQNGLTTIARRGGGDFRTTAQVI